MAKKKNLRVHQDEFISLYKEGISIRKIAEQFGVSKNSVSALIKEKIELRPKSSITKELGESIYNDYLKGIGLRPLSYKYSVPPSSIQRYLTREYSVKFYGDKKYEHLLDDFIRCYEEGMSLQDIANKYSVSKQTVLTYLNENDKKARTYKESGLKYEVDSCYYDELNSEKAYDLGMLFYMTTITTNRHHQRFLNIKINISNEDLLLDLVSKFSDKSHNSIERTARSGKVTTSSIRIFEENLINKLIEYGLGSNSLNIDDKYKFDFFRGYFSLAISVNIRTFNISAKNIDKEIIKAYLNGFMNIKLTNENKTAIIIGNIDGSIQLLNQHKELVGKIEECIATNNCLVDRDIRRWKNIIDKIKE